MSKEYSNKVPHISRGIKQTPVFFLAVFNKLEEIDLEGFIMWQRQVLGESNSNLKPWESNANVGETIFEVILNIQDKTITHIVNGCVMKAINPCKHWCFSPSVNFSFSSALSVPTSFFFMCVYPLLHCLPIWPVAVCSVGCSVKVHATVAGAFVPAPSLIQAWADQVGTQPCTWLSLCVYASIISQCLCVRTDPCIPLSPNHIPPSSPPPYLSFTHLGATIREALGWWAKPPLSPWPPPWGRRVEPGESGERRAEKLPAHSCTPSSKAVTSKEHPGWTERRSWLERERERVCCVTLSSCPSVSGVEGEKVWQAGEIIHRSPRLSDLASLWVYTTTENLTTA